MKIPRNLSLIKFDTSNLDEKYIKQYPFKPTETMVYLGEIPNMNGHCVIARQDGTISVGWHIENFRELDEDEV